MDNVWFLMLFFNKDKLLLQNIIYYEINTKILPGFNRSTNRTI